MYCAGKGVVLESLQSQELKLSQRDCELQSSDCSAEGKQGPGEKWVTGSCFSGAAPNPAELKQDLSLCACVNERQTDIYRIYMGGGSHKGLSFLKPQDDSFCLPGIPDGVTLPKAMFTGRIF